MLRDQPANSLIAMMSPTTTDRCPSYFLRPSSQKGCALPYLYPKTCDIYILPPVPPKSRTKPTAQPRRIPVPMLYRLPRMTLERSIHHSLQALLLAPASLKPIYLFLGGLPRMHMASKVPIQKNDGNYLLPLILHLFALETTQGMHHTRFRRCPVLVCPVLATNKQWDRMLLSNR